MYEYCVYSCVLPPVEPWYDKCSNDVPFVRAPDPYVCKKYVVVRTNFLDGPLTYFFVMRRRNKQGRRSHNE